MIDKDNSPDAAPGWVPLASAGVETEAEIFGKLMAADADNHRQAADEAAQWALSIGMAEGAAQAVRERVLGQLAAFHARQAAEMWRDLNTPPRH